VFVIHLILNSIFQQMAFNFSLQYFYPFNFHIVKKNCIPHINLFILFFMKLKKIVILDISKLLLFLNVQYFMISFIGLLMLLSIFIHLNQNFVKCHLICERFEFKFGHSIKNNN